MSKVYVTEGGYFNKYGQFWGNGILGVDKNPKLAVSFPIKRGCYRHQVKIDDLGFVIIYKSSFSDRGFRVTSIDEY